MGRGEKAVDRVDGRGGYSAGKDDVRDEGVARGERRATAAALLWRCRSRWRHCEALCRQWLIFDQGRNIIRIEDSRRSFKPLKIVSIKGH